MSIEDKTKKEEPQYVLFVLRGRIDSKETEDFENQLIHHKIPINDIIEIETGDVEFSIPPPYISTPMGVFRSTESYLKEKERRKILDE